MSRFGPKPIPPLLRFMRYVRADLSGCWVWTGARDHDGYGIFEFAARRAVRVHRWLYEQIHGVIPNGLHCDHLCRNRRCIRPSHLEAVTCGENIRRGATGLATRLKLMARTHCARGHPFDVSNTLWQRGPKGAVYRRCRACRRARERL